jgi:nuclear transport factor 2 (NTF2) superfamily protein
MTTAALVPPVSNDTAVAKVLAGENLWNTRDPARVALGYTPDTERLFHWDSSDSRPEDHPGLSDLGL